MTGRMVIAICLLVLLLCLGPMRGPYGQAQEEGAAPAVAQPVPPEHPTASETTGEQSESDFSGLVDGDLIEGPRTAGLPEDPCLHPLYKDWYEFAVDARHNDPEHGFVAFRILLDRSTFTLNFQGLRRDRSAETIYQSACGLGEIDSPTPEGTFIINHVYSYPDAAFFGLSGEPHRGLYNGFFAPLLACDDSGRCSRFQELGIHGFNPSAYPEPAAVRRETCGAVSAGCIRVPDPCKFKSTLIRMVGVGPPKRNDRGSYHWLNKPVEVIISGDYPGTQGYSTLVSLFEQGLGQVRDGLKSVWRVWGD
jgi:hypothetical protein